MRPLSDGLTSAAEGKAQGQLYSEAIRERWRRPRFRGEVAAATGVAEDVNPLCGDRVRMEIRTEGERVEAVRFVGDSCAICTASADVIAEMAEGRSLAAARAIGVDAVLSALGAEIRPTRMGCVRLPLTVFARAIGER